MCWRSERLRFVWMMGYYYIFVDDVLIIDLCLCVHLELKELLVKVTSVL